MSENTKTRQVVRQRLREARQLAGLSQGDVARMLKMHRPTISEIEAGRRSVSAEEIVRFADVYHVGIEWLFGRDRAKSLPRNGSNSSKRYAAEEWSEAKNARRCELIDRKIQESITPDEEAELDSLQQALRDYLDRVAPLPLEGAKRLHAKLLRASQRK